MDAGGDSEEVGESDAGFLILLILWLIIVVLGTMMPGLRYSVWWTESYTV